MLKLIDKPDRADDEAFTLLVDLLKKVDGFTVLIKHNNKLEVAQMGMSYVDIVYACEYVKSKIFSGEKFCEHARE